MKEFSLGAGVLTFSSIYVGYPCPQLGLGALVLGGFLVFALHGIPFDLRK